MKDEWNIHYTKITEKDYTASTTLLKALELFEQEDLAEQTALDLGCGTGIDTIALLNKGWIVTAVDKQQEALEHLMKNTYGFSSSLNIIHGFFDNIPFPSVNLVNASFSLPFCHPILFEDLWEHLTAAIHIQGRFAGHFFGKNDSWSSDTEMTFLDKRQIHSLFTGFSIEWFEETEKDGKTIRGMEKHWHVFHIVAKKI